VAPEGEPFYPVIATVAATMNTSGQIAAILSQPVVGYSVK
jgi:hypothetical protein